MSIPLGERLYSLEGNDGGMGGGGVGDWRAARDDKVKCGGRWKNIGNETGSFVEKKKKLYISLPQYIY